MDFNTLPRCNIPAVDVVSSLLRDVQDALRYGGPVGAFLGYMIVGTVVYCLCVSIAEMIAYLYVFAFWPLVKKDTKQVYQT